MRDLRITVAGINIVTHPHNAETYKELMRTLFNLKIAVPVYGDQHLIMSQCSIPRDDDLIKGTISRFTELQSDLSWFNTESMDEADENEINEINIPANLRPNHVSFWFAFDPKTHTFVYEQQLKSFRISPVLMNKYFQYLISNKLVQKKFSSVIANIISDTDALDKILAIPHLREVKILINRPNPDGIGSYDAEIEMRLKSMHAQSEELTYKAEPNGSLMLDEETKALADVATRNGRVETKGRDAAGLPVKKSSEAIPLLLSKEFATDGISSVHFFDAAKDFINRVKASVTRGRRQ